MIAAVGWFALGGAAWPLAEYFIHRFVGHGPRRVPSSSWLVRITPQGWAAQFNHEHLSHHADPTYFAAAWLKVMSAIAVIPPLGLVLSLGVGPLRGVAFAVGFAAVYGAYEVLHRRIHTNAPLGPYGRWARKHHLAHHHKNPRQNHGVTMPLFDLLFRTEVGTPEQLLIPRRVAPVWLLDENGEVREAHRADYRAG